MKTINAKNLKVNNIIMSGKYRFIVISTDRVTDKAITYTTNRLSPDPYDGNFFNRSLLDTKLTIE